MRRGGTKREGMEHEKGREGRGRGGKEGGRKGKEIAPVAGNPGDATGNRNFMMLLYGRCPSTVKAISIH